MVFQPLKLMDGVLLAAKKKTFVKNAIRFDEQFQFHFYDMDICRQFDEKNVTMAAAPMGVIHRSGGAFGASARAITASRADSSLCAMGLPPDRRRLQRGG